METDELDTYLGSLAREDPWRVDAVLKSGRLEATQRVYFVGRDGSELGPFIRKRLSVEAGLGSAYEEVMAAQRRGVRLAHLPRIVSCERSGDELTVVMELVRGETLEQAVGEKNGAAARLELTRAVFGDLCDAVSELHEQLSPPIIHRDLKPSNVMVNEGGVTLIDLGIARSYKEGGESDTTHFGTRPYAPPEQFGFGQTDVRSDVYALGMVLFTCLTGREPTVAARERSFVGAGLPEPLRRVIVEATQLDPARRPPTARALRDAVASALGEGAEAADVPAAEAPRRSRLARVPEGVGVVWDVFVAALAVLMLASCVNAFLNPTPENASNPTWYNAFSYLVFMPLLLLAWLYQLLDRRPLRRRVSAFARLTVRQELRLALIVTGVLIVAFVVLTIPASAS